MNSSSPPSFTFPAAPIGSLIQGARPDLLRLPLWYGGWRRFLIIPAGFGCEVGMDAWVGGYVPGVGVAIQLTLPPQPFRAAWWQLTLLIHVAWVRRVRNVKQGVDNECDSCRPFWFTYTGCPSRYAPTALVVWGAGRRYCIRVSRRLFRAGIRVWVGERHNFEVSALTNYQISFKHSISPTSQSHRGFFAV
jgi:hypothetical protein